MSLLDSITGFNAALRAFCSPWLVFFRVYNFLLSRSCISNVIELSEPLDVGSACLSNPCSTRTGVLGGSKNSPKKMGKTCSVRSSCLVAY